MDLKYVVLTIIKILISVPTVLLVPTPEIEASILMGGHLDNKSNSTDHNPVTIDYDSYDSKDISLPQQLKPVQANKTYEVEDDTFGDYMEKETTTSEEIPKPSPLVLPGYNLPENIFNRGKPFYLEKDPATGAVDFNSKSSLADVEDDEYEYIEEKSNEELYDKTNIDRRDSNVDTHHRPSDVNQLVPNFHDFLNLPVKYSSDKYVYPLISSSYANTKVQGNVNKQHNHKDYEVTTYKPTGSPTYYYTTKSTYMKPSFTQKKEYYTTVKTTTAIPTTNRIYSTTNKLHNLMNSAMSHRNHYEETQTTEKYLHNTKQNVNTIYLTTRAPFHTSTTTKRTMSLFEQLFGDYEDAEPTEMPKLPTLHNSPSSVQKFEDNTTPISLQDTNVLSGSHMQQENLYEYEEYDEGNVEDNVAVENKIVQTTSKITDNITTTEKLSTTSVLPNATESKSQNVHIDIPSSTLSSLEITTSTKVTSLPIGENHIVNHNQFPTSSQVTSLPIGENHITPNNQPATLVEVQGLREKLNNEKVLPNNQAFDFHNPVVEPAPSKSNIHIAHDQDTVSFVVGNHQSVDGGKYVGTAVKEKPYDANQFKQSVHSTGYTIDPKPMHIKYPEFSGSSVTIQPLRNSEASLAIGVPVDGIKKVPGQVMDEKLDLSSDKFGFPKEGTTKVVFPEEKQPTHFPDLVPPPKQHMPPTREVLKLSSKPMFHQLPSDLTPPGDIEIPGPPRIDRPRPPWDPRPGHFYSGRPEYVRPPRPPPGELAYKRIDNLPNILPQFRPNVKNAHSHHPFENVNPNKGYIRQPLLDRPSNRPSGFFEKLHPPPLPPHVHNLRKIPNLEKTATGLAKGKERISDVPKKLPAPEQFGFLHTPPKIVLPNRRSGNEEPEVETLQMIQAKQTEKQEITKETVFESEKEDAVTDKPLYVVYPVNSALKLDALDTTKKETVVIGTRAELPLPPSKIGNDFNYEHKDRNDAPVLKPQVKPANFPVKSDFPYPLERPDPSVLNPPVPETPVNNLDSLDTKLLDDNQWHSVNDAESRVVTGTKINGQNSNQISVTLKTYTEKPIAVAYTPTQPPINKFEDRYSVPNYASQVIPEIRPGSITNIVVGHGKPDTEFTLGAVMHSKPKPHMNYYNTHKIDDSSDTTHVPAQDFQAPFQASISIDSSMSHGWSVVRDKNKSESEAEAEVTTVPMATTSEFDIENFKPQLLGGFVPIYSYPEGAKEKEEINERQEKEIA